LLLQHLDGISGQSSIVTADKLMIAVLAMNQVG
jgi:hypothetical protein